MRRLNLVWIALLALSCVGTDGEAMLDDLSGRDIQEIVHELVVDPVVPDSEASAVTRAVDLRQQLLRAVHLSPFRTVPQAKVVSVQRTGGVRVEHLLLDGFEGMHVSAVLYVPENATPEAPVPAMVVNVGHDAAGQNAWYIRRLAWSLAQHGVAALTLDWLGTGTRFRDEQRHIPVGLRSILVGLDPEEPLLGEPLAAWDYLAGLPGIDRTRVGMVGQSGGGMTTMHLAAMESKIALAVVVDIVATNRFMVVDHVGWGDPDSVPRGELKTTSHGEILGLIAPRPLLVMSGDRDLGIAPTEVTAEALRVTREWYALRGGTLEHMGFDTAHAFSREKIDRTLEFVGTHFLGVPILGAADPPSSTAPQAVPPSDDVLWLDLVEERWAEAPVVPDSAEAAQAWLRGARAAVSDVLGAGEPADLSSMNAGDEVILLVADDEQPGEMDSLSALGPDVVRVSPLGLNAGGLDGDAGRFLGQNARSVGSSILRLGLNGLQGVIRSVRGGGARRVIVVGRGEQSSLLCIALASTEGPPDALVISDLPRSFEERFELGQPDPALYYFTPGLGAVASPETLVAIAAVRPLAIVQAPQWPFVSGLCAQLGCRIELEAPTLSAATEFVLSALRSE